MDRVIKLGVIGTANIAFDRFLPALKQNKHFDYVGVASRNVSNGKKFEEKFGGKIYYGYNSIIADDSIEALYIPLPPALHYEWAKKALENGKHVFLEKPFTTNFNDTNEIINLAREKNLAVHENYMFMYHAQLHKIREFIDSNRIGQLRLITIRFGFPKRAENDFRYSKDLGGGSLLDCGGYAIKLGNYLLGGNAQIKTSSISNEHYDIDLFGSATMENQYGLTAQIAFGMDNDYKCELEVWGSKGSIYADRIFTAPTGFQANIIIKENNQNTEIIKCSDNQFMNSDNYFYNCITNNYDREKNYNDILKQSKLVDIKFEK